MPPRSSLTSSFSVSDAINEVICPLPNHDGSNCRKRCFGEKRYRSMQEHIRRAHPEHYISKLPATEESFQLMINTPPSEHPQPPPNSAYGSSVYGLEVDAFYNQNQTSPGSSGPADKLRRGSLMPAASAAVALAQLHNSGSQLDFDPDQGGFRGHDSDDHHFHNFFGNTESHNMFNDLHESLNGPDAKTNEPFPPMLKRTPSVRASSLQPRSKPARPRKSSVTENARKPKHQRQRSKDQKRLSHDRKAFSAEPQNIAGLSSRRWEDLLDAVGSATEEESRDLTPIPQSPRGSMPPIAGQNHNHFHSYTTSPLQNAVVTQSPEQSPAFEAPHLEPFPSVETSFDTQAQQHQPYHHHQSSNESSNSNPYMHYRHHAQSSGSNFHIPTEGLSSSPTNPGILSHSNTLQYAQQQYNSHVQQQAAPPLVQHYCAACHRITPLTSSYACTECICGICRDCVDVLVGMGPDRGARCPKCGTGGGKFKPFMLDLR